MPGAFQRLPAGPGGLDRLAVMAIKQIEHSIKCPEVKPLGAVDQSQDRGAVGIFLKRCEIDRLLRRRAVLGAAVRQKALF